MVDAGEDLRERVSDGGRVERSASRSDAAVGHPPQIRKHRADPRHWRTQITRRERAMQQEIHGEPIKIRHFIGRPRVASTNTAEPSAGRLSLARLQAKYSAARRFTVGHRARQRRL